MQSHKKLLKELLALGWKFENTKRGRHPHIVTRPDGKRIPFFTTPPKGRSIINFRKRYMK